MTDNPHYPYTFKDGNCGKSVQFMIETPQEIIAKKIKYRCSKFTLRDVFDLAAVITSMPEILNNLINTVEIQDSFERILNRIIFLNQNKQLFKDGTLITDQNTLLGKIFKITIDALENIVGQDLSTGPDR